MNIFIMMIPGVELPYSTVILFILAIAAFGFVKSQMLRDALGLVLIGTGATLALVAGCDRILLAALILLAVIVSVALGRQHGDKKKGE